MKVLKKLENSKRARVFSLKKKKKEETSVGAPWIKMEIQCSWQVLKET